MVETYWNRLFSFQQWAKPKKLTLKKKHPNTELFNVMVHWKVMGSFLIIVIHCRPSASFKVGNTPDTMAPQNWRKLRGSEQVCLTKAGWWCGCHFWHFPRNIGNLIIPIDFHSYFSEGFQSTNQINIDVKMTMKTNSDGKYLTMKSWWQSFRCFFCSINPLK